ncbi:MAG: hypothetical protein FH749_00340 [Firmicutes bacterium]|nr:hypothetical protein [Bacillota bacterium]
MRKLWQVIVAVLVIVVITGSLTVGFGLVNRIYWVARTSGYRVVSSGDNVLRVNPEFAEHIPALKSKVDYWQDKLDAYFGAEVHQPLIVLTKPERLQAMIGGSEYSLDTAGAYSEGVVLLTVKENGLPEQAVLVHELAHHYVHELSRGNYPVWYSEGLAQLAEWSLTGYLWFDVNENYTYYKYNVSELDENFYGLDSQASAYRRAFEVARFLSDLDGQANYKILKELAAGKNFPAALYDATGLSLTDLDEF